MGTSIHIRMIMLMTVAMLTTTTTHTSIRMALNGNQTPALSRYRL